MPVRLLAHLTVCALVILASGCKFFDSTCDENVDADCLGRNLTGKGVGAECDRTVQCDAYLQCMDGTCQAVGKASLGADCRRTAECGDDLYCDHTRTCARAGAGIVGSDCEGTADCEKGLLCGIGEIPLKLQCVQPQVDPELGRFLDKGEVCSSSIQCSPGLNCLPVLNTCGSVPADQLPDVDGDGVPDEIPPVPVWTPDACPDDSERAVAYFEVPRSDEDEADFYRLPFPNDVRRRGGTVDVSAHPRAEASVGLPVAAQFIDAADTMDGFSTNPVVFFRFSQAFEDIGSEGDLKDGAIRIVNITPDSPEYDRGGSLRWSTVASNYACDNALAVRRQVGDPLLPGTTYAAIITTDFRTEELDDFARADDFKAMLDASAPGNADLKRAWDAYAPLRAWLEDTNTPSSALLTAAVFTTQDPTELVGKMRQVIRADDLPDISELTECGDGVTSPCETMEEDGPRGACVNSGDGYVELHGRISLPSFQVGDAPYLTPDEVDDQVAGDIRMSGAQPVITGHADVCFSLAVPEGDMPTDGWPLLIYAHGTGGSLTSSLGPNGWAEQVATGASPAATLTIDLPQHGDRRGDSTEDPELLFFNVSNPYAARGNVLQGSADLLSVVRWAVDGSIAAGASPTGSAIDFDATRIAVLGHSQGATHTAIMLPFEPDVTAAMLSGVGGHLSTSMLTKTEPLPISDFAGILLLDPERTSTALSAGLYNPALAMVQTFYEPADPINYARLLVQSPTSLAPTGHHVFMSYGLDDSYSPEDTQEAYARAGGFPLVLPPGSSPLRSVPLSEIDAPASANVEVGGVPRTFGMHQYEPRGDRDGHFVAVSSGQDGFPHVRAFLQSVFAGQTPSIGD